MEKVSRRGFCMAAMAAGAAGVAGAQEALSALADEAAPEAPEKPYVYVTDRFVTKPGDGEAFMNDYLDFYGSRAEQIAELEDVRVAPPVWLEHDTNTIVFTWRCVGTAGAQPFNGTFRFDEEVHEWWGRVAERVVSRDRSYYASAKDLEVLCNV